MYLFYEIYINILIISKEYEEDYKLMDQKFSDTEKDSLEFEKML